MPTSATDQGAVARVLREAGRRLVHELNNVSNAAAVNVEVVRSRLGRPEADSAALAPFAARAAEALERLGDGLAAANLLLAALAEAGQNGGLTARPATTEPGAVEVVIPPSRRVEPAAQRFAAEAGVQLSAGRDGVILQILRRGAAEPT